MRDLFAGIAEAHAGIRPLVPVSEAEIAGGRWRW